MGEYKVNYGLPKSTLNYVRDGGTGALVLDEKQPVGRITTFNSLDTDLEEARKEIRDLRQQLKDAIYTITLLRSSLIVIEEDVFKARKVSDRYKKH